MSCKSLNLLRNTTGLRLTVWYSGLFMLSAVVLFVLAYALLWSSLRQTDRESTALELHELAALYHDSGLEGVTREIELQRRLQGAQPFFIRLADPQHHTGILILSDQWAEFHLKQLKKMTATADLQWIE